MEVDHVIKVTLTNEILKRISEIDEKRFSLSTIEMPPVIKNKLRKNSKKKSSYASNKIEGNPLTEKQANEAIDSDSHKHFLKPEQEVRNYFLALNFLEEKLKKKEAFSKEMILEVQAMVEKGASKEKIGLRGPMPPGMLFAVYDSETGAAEYIPPEYIDIPDLLDELVEYVNTTDDHPLIIAAVVHYQLVTIHPFEDGNGRLARILSDMLLARGEKSELRFYNISAQINKDKNHYYDILERMQRGDGDITEWLVWYMKKLLDALDEAETMVTTILNKSFFWQKASSVPMTERQTKMLNLFLDGYEAKITSKTWASLAKCSKDTAIRDIQDLVSKNILVEDIPGAKRPSYSIVFDAEDLTQFFTDVCITQENATPYLNALFKGHRKVCERILPLDAERYQKGDLLLPNLLNKYCSYLMAND